MTPISFSLQGAAEATGLSVRALQYAIEDGRLVVHYYGAKPVLYAADIEAFIQSLPTEPAPRRKAAS